MYCALSLLIPEKVNASSGKKCTSWKKKNLGNWDADWAERLKNHLPGIFFIINIERNICTRNILFLITVQKCMEIYFEKLLS